MLLSNIQQDQAVMHVGTGEFVPRGLWLDPEDIFLRFFFQPSNAGQWVS